MKVLIIEDAKYVCMQMEEILKGIKEIEISFGQSVGENMFGQIGLNGMLTFSEVVKKIEKADLVLLDHQLGMNYDGADLLPHCKGKKVLGISSIWPPSMKNFDGKDSLRMEHVRQRFLETVISML